MAMILFTVLGSFWLELFLKTGVLRRFKRAFLSIFPVAILFLAWDAYAISKGIGISIKRKCLELLALLISHSKNFFFLQ